MTCVNCETDRRAYTLHAHVDDSDSTIELPFCSSDCLDEWV
jgi:hypothetical protein